MTDQDFTDELGRHLGWACGMIKVADHPIEMLVAWNECENPGSLIIRFRGLDPSTTVISDLSRIVPEQCLITVGGKKLRYGRAYLGVYHVLESYVCARRPRRFKLRLC